LGVVSIQSEEIREYINQEIKQRLQIIHDDKLDDLRGLIVQEVKEQRQRLSKEHDEKFTRTRAELRELIYNSTKKVSE
jgi:hypothetical protein